MHNRALHDSLAAFVEEAAWQLAEEVSGGAEIPFELDATPTRSAPLYCYRPLTGRFIAQRIGMLSRLPSYPSAARGLTALPDLPAYLQRRGRRVPVGDPRALADSALQAFLGAVWADATDFVFDAERFRVAYAELEEIAYAGCELSVVLARRRRARDRVRRGPARRGPLARARRRRSPTRRPASPTTRTPPSPCWRWRRAPATGARSRTPAAACAGCRPRCACGTTPSPRSARRPGRAPTAARGWPSRSPPACAARAGDCLLAAEEEDPLRAFCGLVARRTPRAGELAWALRRFELGCERGSAVEALTDWLMAARALFADTDRAGYDGVAERLAAICAELARPPAARGPRARGDLARARRDGGLRAPRHRGRRARVRARRLPARRPARRALWAPRPGAAARGRRPTGRWAYAATGARCAAATVVESRNTGWSPRVQVRSGRPSRAVSRSRSVRDVRERSTTATLGRCSAAA